MRPRVCNVLGMRSVDRDCGTRGGAGHFPPVSSGSHLETKGISHWGLSSNGSPNGRFSSDGSPNGGFPATDLPMGAFQQRIGALARYLKAVISFRTVSPGSRDPTFHSCRLRADGGRVQPAVDDHRLQRVGSAVRPLRERCFLCQRQPSLLGRARGLSCRRSSKAGGCRGTSCRVLRMIDRRLGLRRT